MLVDVESSQKKRGYACGHGVQTESVWIVENAHVDETIGKPKIFFALLPLFAPAILLILLLYSCCKSFSPHLCSSFFSKLTLPSVIGSTHLHQQHRLLLDVGRVLFICLHKQAQTRMVN